MVAGISRDERRIVLTRDRALLQRKIITHGYFVRADKPRLQVREVLSRLDLYGAIAPFTRCLRCNGELKQVSKDSISDRLPPLTKQYYERFRLCRECAQIYWEGSHLTRATRLVEELAHPGD